MIKSKSTQSVKELSEKLFHLMDELGYAKSTIGIYRKVYSDFFMFASDCCSDPIFTEQLTIDYMKKYHEEHDTSTSAGKKRARETQRLINMLSDCHVHGVILRHKIRNKVIPEPYSSEIDAFCAYLTQNGLSQGTAERNRFVMEQLSNFLFQNGKKDFIQMSMEDLLAFSSTQMGYSKKTVAATMYALRVFIDYLDQTGKNKQLCKKELPAVHFVSRRHMPKIWTEDECQKILEAVEKNTPVGKRDFAILSLAINYGMRTSDILNLKFSDIDWQAAKISFVQKKTGILNSLTFDEKTGWAIIDYIRNGRPDIEQYANVFLQAKAPYLPMNNFNSCLQKYVERAGIHCEKEQMHSMHSLRHSLATRLLNHDIPTVTIADVLGHINVNSSVDYLQVDVEHLRQCALETEVEL